MENDDSDWRGWMMIAIGGDGDADRYHHSPTPSKMVMVNDDSDQ